MTISYRVGDKGSLGREGVYEEVREWQVWFRTPTGLVGPNELRRAVEICESLDMHPDICIVPVPVAIVNNELWEPIR
jgi:hypothetical protein